MPNLKRTAIILTGMVIFVTSTAMSCTQEQIRTFQASSPEVQQNWLAALQTADTAPSDDHSATDCDAEMRRHFPASAQSRMAAIIARESGGVATARGPSGAAGCYQMLPMHSSRLPSGGSFYNAHDASVAARSLYDEAGFSPWGY